MPGIKLDDTELSDEELCKIIQDANRQIEKMEADFEVETRQMKDRIEALKRRNASLSKREKELIEERKRLRKQVRKISANSPKQAK